MDAIGDVVASTRISTRISSRLSPAHAGSIYIRQALDKKHFGAAGERTPGGAIRVQELTWGQQVPLHINTQIETHMHSHAQTALTRTYKCRHLCILRLY